MSHHQRIRTQWREREHLVQALQDMGFEVQEGEHLVVRTSLLWRKMSDIVAHTGCGYDIGFRLRGQEYEIVVCWPAIEQRTSIRQHQFLEQLRQRYAYNLIRDRARRLGLDVGELRTLPNGEAVLVLTETPESYEKQADATTSPTRSPSHYRGRHAVLKEIKATLHADGTQTVEVINAIGKECVEFSEPLEQRLGTPVGPRKFKPEYSRLRPPQPELQGRSAREFKIEPDTQDEVHPEWVDPAEALEAAWRDRLARAAARRESRESLSLANDSQDRR